MQPKTRRILAAGVLMLVCAGAVLAYSRGTVEPADFTFNNDTEIKTVDPAKVTGNPEGRIVRCLFEGLTNLDPKTLEAIPGLAERWEISDDKLTYTFHLRDCVWSNGEKILAPDVVWSYKRFLHPDTASEYVYQLWYCRNAKKFSSLELAVGDAVEVELPRTSPDSDGLLPFADGPILHGKLLEILQPPAEDSYSESPKKPKKSGKPDIYVVEIDGQPRKFSSSKSKDESVEMCEWVLPDFNTVGIKAPDEKTIVFELDRPTPFFPSLVGFYPTYPVNRKCYETHGYPNWTKPDNIVTSGPFRLVFRKIRDRIRMAKSETYWDRANVKLGIVDALAIESSTTALNMYLTGQVDWIPQVPSTVVQELRSTRDDYQPAPYLSIYFYRINTTKPPLDNKLVRQALSLALNRDEIISLVARSGETSAYSLVPPGFRGYEAAYAPTYDPQEARRLLAQAGYPGGKGMPHIEILFNQLETHKSIAELIQGHWKTNLGIDVRLRVNEWGVYLQEVRQLQYYVARAGWIADYNDPNTYLDLFLTGGANNQTGWGNPQYDALVAQAQNEFDEEKRMQIFHQAEEILVDELPVIPIYYYVSKNMVRPYVKGIYPNSQDLHPLNHVEVDFEEKARVLAEESLR